MGRACGVMNKSTGRVRIFTVAESARNNEYFLCARSVNVQYGIHGTRSDFKHECFAATWFRPEQACAEAGVAKFLWFYVAPVFCDNTI